MQKKAQHTLHATCNIPHATHHITLKAESVDDPQQHPPVWSVWSVALSRHVQGASPNGPAVCNSNIHLPATICKNLMPCHIVCISNRVASLVWSHRKSGHPFWPAPQGGRGRVTWSNTVVCTSTCSWHGWVLGWVPPRPMWGWDRSQVGFRKGWVPEIPRLLSTPLHVLQCVYFCSTQFLEFVIAVTKTVDLAPSNIRICLGGPWVGNRADLYHGVFWCGVVWCGVVWCGVVWCGVVWWGGVW